MFFYKFLNEIGNCAFIYIFLLLISSILKRSSQAAIISLLDCCCLLQDLFINSNRVISCGFFFCEAAFTLKFLAHAMSLNLTTVKSIQGQRIICEDQRNC